MWIGIFYAILLYGVTRARRMDSCHHGQLSHPRQNASAVGPLGQVQLLGWREYVVDLLSFTKGCGFSNRFLEQHGARFFAMLIFIAYLAIAIQFVGRWSKATS